MGNGTLHGGGYFTRRDPGPAASSSNSSASATSSPRRTPPLDPYAISHQTDWAAVDRVGCAARPSACYEA